MNEYSEKVIEHFKNPRNAGIIEDPDGVGEIGDPSCGDFLRVFIKVRDERIVDVKYQIRGCPAAIACASVMTELAMDKHIDDALMLEDQDIVDVLEGLPEYKMHCSLLSISGLRKALIDHFEKTYKKEHEGS